MAVEIIPEATPFTETAALTSQLTPRPQPSARTTSVHRRPAPGTRSTPLAPPSEDGGKSKVMTIAMIAGGVLVLGIGGCLFFGKSGKKQGGGAAAVTSILSKDPPKVSFQLPQDRAYPPVDQAMSLFYVGNTGVLTNRKGSNGRPAVANTNDVVVEWHDISERGGDNILRAFSGSADYAPKRVNWPEAAKGGSPRAGRAVLDFRPRNGQPCALVLDSPGSESVNMPFAPGDVPGGDAGLTVVVAFQADPSRLPTRVFMLGDGDGTTVSMRVDTKKNLVVEIKSPGGSPVITSTAVDGTIASLALLTWNSKTNAVELRARDSMGMAYTSSGVRATAPVNPLAQLQIGSGDGAAKDHFSGYLAELFVYSIALKGDQLQQIDGRVRDYYFLPPPPAPLKQRLKSKLAWIEPRDAWVLDASHKSGDAPKVVDGDTVSRWTTGAAMQGKEFFTVQLPSETDIAGLAIDSQGNYQDYARKYRIELSTDGKAWGKPVAEGNGSALTEITFKPQRARYVRISQTATSGAHWSINELVLFKP